MSWRRVGVSFGIGVASYALALIAMAPASLLDAQLQSASNGRLRLAEAQGSVWSGSGRLEVREPGSGTGFGQPLIWRWQPGALAGARLGFDVEIGQGSRPFPLTMSWAHIEIADADISWPAASLGLGMAAFAPFGLTGELRLRVTKIALAAGDTQGSAALQWHQAGSTLSSLSPFGDYELRLKGEGATVSATLHTLTGPLQLEGEGSSANGRQATFRVAASMPPSMQERLAPFLRLIAVERGDGSFELRRP